MFGSARCYSSSFSRNGILQNEQKVSLPSFLPAPPSESPLTKGGKRLGAGLGGAPSLWRWAGRTPNVSGEHLRLREEGAGHFGLC